jgi:hypothetical protein
MVWSRFHIPQPATQGFIEDVGLAHVARGAAAQLRQRPQAQWSM